MLSFCTRNRRHTIPSTCFHSLPSSLTSIITLAPDMIIALAPDMMACHRYVTRAVKRKNETRSQKHKKKEPRTRTATRILVLSPRHIAFLKAGIPQPMNRRRQIGGRLQATNARDIPVIQDLAQFWTGLAFALVFRKSGCLAKTRKTLMLIPSLSSLFLSFLFFLIGNLPTYRPDYFRQSDGAITTPNGDI